MKFFITVIFLFFLFVAFVLKYFSQYVSEVVAIVISFAIIGAIIMEKRNYKKMMSAKPESIPLSEELAEETYHNDFSKVPSGERDIIQPKPREIYFHDRTIDEDMERIGLVDPENNNKKS